MKNKGRKDSLFWTSYSDLMTSLFFVVLVLFVITTVAMGMASLKTKLAYEELEDALKRLENVLDSVNASNSQLEQIIKLNDQFSSLASSTSLDYDSEKRMFYAKDFVGIEIFDPNEDVIKNEYIEMVDKVGKDIKSIVDSLNKSNNSFKYQLVIEGTAAIPYREKINKTFNPDNIEMYKLSYRRALALYQRWKALNLRDSNTEIIIAGSGFNGVNRDQIIEENNKRFVIQIIPKIEKPVEKGNVK